MFLTGIVIIVVAVVLIVAGVSIRKRGAIRGSSYSLIGKIGIVVGIGALIGSGIRIIGPGEVLAQSHFDDLQTELIDRGIIIEKVLLRSIRLPATVTQGQRDKSIM